MRSLRNVMHTACVMQASPVMHAFGAGVERIASPITAKLHFLFGDRSVSVGYVEYSLLCNSTTSVAEFFASIFKKAATD